MRELQFTEQKAVAGGVTAGRMVKPAPSGTVTRRRSSRLADIPRREIVVGMQIRADAQSNRTKVSRILA